MVAAASCPRHLGLPQAANNHADATLMVSQIRTFKYFSNNDTDRLLKNLSSLEFSPKVVGKMTSAINFAVDGINKSVAGVRAVEVQKHSMSGKWIPRWVPSSEYPHVYKLAITGGVCSGKSSGMKFIARDLEIISKNSTIVLHLPEVASLLFNLGAMNYGIFEGYSAAEFQEFEIQSELLQLALEDLWAEGVEDILKSNTFIKRAVLLTDRDALDSKVYSLPIDPASTSEWRIILQETGRRIGRPNLSEQDLVERYQLGVIVLESLAVHDPKLYETKCVGPKGDNIYRRETVAEARLNDRRVQQVYVEAYPRQKIRFITKHRDLMSKIREEADFAEKQLREFT